MKIQLKILILLAFPFVLKAQNIPTIISEINPSSPSSNPNDFICVDDNLFFTATTVINDTEPFPYPLPTHIGITLIKNSTSIDALSKTYTLPLP